MRGEGTHTGRGRAYGGWPTARQQECVALTWRGLSDREIARHLGISPSTVHRHLQEVYRLLGLTGTDDPRLRAALLLWRECARRAGVAATEGGTCGAL